MDTHAHVFTCIRMLELFFDLDFFIIILSCVNNLNSDYERALTLPVANLAPADRK